MKAKNLIVVGVLLLVGGWVMAAEIAGHEEALELWAEAKFDEAKIQWGEDGVVIVRSDDPAWNSQYRVMRTARCTGGNYVYDLVQESAGGNTFFIIMVSPDGRRIQEYVDNTLKPGSKTPEGNFVLNRYER
jgi:hypothetical protein